MILKSIKEKIQKRNNYVKFLRKRGCRIGSGCEIYPSADFGSEPYLITIGNHVRVNSGVKIITHDGGVWVLREKECWKDADLFATVKIGNNVHIGTNAIIMPGVTIGDNCIVGCGAIVTKNIPDSSVVVGVPARVIETIDDYIEKHQNDFDYTKFLRVEEKRAYLERKYLNNRQKT